MSTEPTSSESPRADLPVGAGGVIRCLFGGVLMGLANLVPGISGGTMLLAVGIYRLIIEAIAGLASMRSPVRNALVLGLVIVPALLAIVALSGFAGRFVLEHRWIAYSLFVGLTLGGVPVLLRSLGRLDILSLFGSFLGIGIMALLAWSDGASGGEVSGSGFVLLLIAGLAAGGAMLLPGLSGSYILLILGQYVVVLTAVDDARAAVSARDWGELASAGGTILPVGIGVIVGIGLVGIVVRWCLHKHRSLTMGVLLGLLLGALLGLWPFKTPVPPEVGSTVRGVLIETVEQAEAVKTKYWPTVGFTPSGAQVAGGCGLILAGMFISSAIGLFGSAREDEEPAKPSMS